MTLDHVTLLVSSLERSLPYYEALLPLLGFSKAKDHVWSNGHGFFFQFREAKSGTHPYERYGAGMKPYVVTTASIFALLTLVHAWRALAVEQQLLGDPWFIFVTALSTAFAGWGFWVLRRARRA